MTLPVVVSENDLAAVLGVACRQTCRDHREQAGMLAVAAHLDPLFVPWSTYAEDTWEATPCPVCDAPVGRNDGPVCRECNEVRAGEWAAWEASR